jgi:two-component system, NtrC family, sensor kinase
MVRAHFGLFFAALFATVEAHADPQALSLDDHTRNAPLAPHCVLLRDPSSTRSMRDVLSETHTQVVKEEGIREGFTSDTVWLRCRIRNITAVRNEWLLDVSTHLDRVDVYVVTGAETRVEHGGRLWPIVDRSVRYPSFVAPVAIEGHSDAHVLIRARSASPMAFRPRIWASHMFVDHAVDELLAMGLFYGLLLVVLVYNLGLYVATRERSYRIHAVFVAAVGLFAAMADQLLATLVTPHSAAWQATSGVRFGAVLILATIALARDFLATAVHAPRIDRWATTGNGIATVLFLSTFVSNSVVFKQGTIAFASVTLLGIVTASVMALRSGHRNARWMLAGWLLSTVTFLLLGAVQVGVAPAGVFNENAWRGGVVFMTMSLSLAFTARMRTLREEKEHAERILLSSRAALAEELEIRVNERTRELEETTKHLATVQGLIARQKRMASLGQLVAALVHEVANPLNFTMGGASELVRRSEALRTAMTALRSRYPDDADVSRAHVALTASLKALDLVQGGNTRIGSVIESLRTYIRSGTREVGAVNLMEVLHSTLSLMEEKFRNSRVEVVVDVEVLPPVRGHTGEIGQILMNVLLNGAQAMPQGGTLVVDGGHDSERVWMSVSDTGPGVPAERRSDIFEPYVTTRADEGGTGLGLSISHEIAQQHGGDLVLDATASGAKFVLRLPRWKDHSSESTELVSDRP